MDQYNLTAHQVVIMDLVAEGFSNEHIGRELGISHRSVHKALGRIGRRIGCGDRAGIVGWSYRIGLFKRQPDLPAKITRREFEVLRQVAAGLSNPEIAENLKLSPNTVGTYVERALGSLNALNRAHAVRRAVDCGALRLVPKSETL